MYETAKMSVGFQICQQAATRLKCSAVIETKLFYLVKFTLFMQFMKCAPMKQFSSIASTNTSYQCCNISGYRCRSRQSFGGAKDFCPNFPKPARKNSKNHDLQKNSSSQFGRHYFQIKVLGIIFAHIFREF